MLCLLWLLRRHIGALAYGELGGAIGRQVAAAAVMAVAVWSWLQWSAWPDTGWAVWLTAGGGVMIAAGVYLAAALLLSSAELRPLLVMVRRRKAV